VSSETTNPNLPPQLLLTPREAARSLRISERSLWAMTSPRGPVPSVRLGRSVRYPAAALYQWIAEQQEVPVGIR